MIRIPYRNAQLDASSKAHFQAVCAYVRSKSLKYQRELFEAVTAVVHSSQDFEESIKTDDWSWLEKFLLADVDTLRKMTEKEAALQFDQFKKLYLNRFSAGAKTYVDNATRYNAYTFVKNLGITVCPYCDEEFLDLLESEEKGSVRTLEIDHYFPKGKYPALAMCFYNLIPSGQNCNGLKLEKALGMNPFEANIETCTSLHPDIPIGINMELVSDEECTIRFHPRGGMEQNVDVLRLEERYDRHKPIARHYLLLNQQYPEEKIAECVRLGVFPSAEHAYQFLYGISSRDQLLQKLKRDITGK